MTEALIWYVFVLGTATLFLFIGIYAARRKKPMWFWAGSQVSEDSVTDVRAYNRENGRMWMLYSLWYYLAGFSALWNFTVAVILLFAGCAVGTAFLVGTFLKIEKKYKVR